MTSSTYLSVTVDFPEELGEAVENFFHEAGALGLEVRDREAPPMPGVRGPATGEAIVVAYFDERATADAVLSELREQFPTARGTLGEVPLEDWSQSWKALIKSTLVGRLWVGPPWELPQAPADRVRIVIEPKMAFGTGDHPTTALCLAAVDDFLAKHPGASVLDVGTGTGVLAIAARKLGASRAVGTDNDAVSVTLARENAVVNGTPEVELSGSALGDVPGTFDLVVANILANTLVELAPLLVPKVGTRLVLAGVLAHQAEDVTAAFVAAGLQRDGGAQEGNWVRLDFSR